MEPKINLSALKGLKTCFFDFEEEEGSRKDINAKIFGQISTSEISKFEEILGKNCKIRLFFFKCEWRSAKMSEKNKKNF